ncbi:MAG: hypothetical protein ABSF92_11020 [Candidatus Acidiferrales bacterium]|jgi:hypothetical protein
MARYITMHTLACLTRQGAEVLAQRLAAATGIKAQRVRFNMLDGKMLVEFEAAGREALERWLQAEGFHFDWLLRLELEFADGKLKSIE